MQVETNFTKINRFLHTLVDQICPFKIWGLQEEKIDINYGFPQNLLVSYKAEPDILEDKRHQKIWESLLKNDAVHCEVSVTTSANQNRGDFQSDQMWWSSAKSG